MSIQIDGISEEELKAMFYEEADSLLQTYESALLRLEQAKNLPAQIDAYSDVFRVFHSFKGAGAYFEEMQQLVDFSSKSCEIYRYIEERNSLPEGLAKWTMMGYSQLSTAIFAIKNGLSLHNIIFYYPPETLLQV